MANTTMQKAAGRAAGRSANAPQAGLRTYIKQMEGEIKKALPSVITPERFTRITLSALSTNPKLAETTPQSFLGAMMTAAQLGMEPNTPLGQAYLIPFWNRRRRALGCQFQRGYKGRIDLAYRSGEVSVIQAHVVCENDEFEYAFGLDPSLKHIPIRSGRGAPTHVYGMFRTKDGGYGFEVMSMEEVREHAKRYSKAYDSGPWQTNFEEMAKKTVLKRVLKYAPLKSDFLRGVALDGSVHAEISEDMYAAPAEYVEAEGYEVDPDTGEITGEPEPEAPLPESEPETEGLLGAAGK